MTIKEAIKELEYNKAMVTFDPTRGEEIDPMCLSEENRRFYDAIVIAIKALREREQKVVIINTDIGGEAV